jgi:hypothetical protein
VQNEMTTQRYGDVDFRGTLEVNLIAAEIPNNPKSFLSVTREHGLARYGMTSRNPRFLWLAPGCIRFTGIVRAGGRDLIGWRVCFIQSISHGTWTGYYSTGTELRCRLNTTVGLLNDGMDGELRFCQISRFRVGDRPSESVAEIDDSDTPNVSFWPEFSGDPFQPQRGEHRGRLIRTEGETRFLTHLAVVNEMERAVVTLGECHWTVSWDGEYDAVAGLWHPPGPNGMITHRIIKRHGSYVNPTSAAESPPFSLCLGNALGCAEIEAREGWVACRAGLPAPACSDPPTNVKWGELP